MAKRERGKSPFGARLERVRTEVAGIDSVSGFRQRLVEGADVDFSDAAVRYYHMGQDYEGWRRDAPATYLARVLDVFPDVRAEWLLRGVEPMTSEEEAAADVATDRLADGEQARREAWARARQEMADAELSLAEQVRAESGVLFRDDDGLVWRAYVAALRRLVAASPLQRPLTETEILDLAGSLTGHLLATYASLYLHNAYPRPAGFSARRGLPVRGSWRFSAFAVGFLQTMASTAAEGSAPVPEDLNADIVAPATEEGGRDGEA